VSIEEKFFTFFFRAKTVVKSNFLYNYDKKPTKKEIAMCFSAHASFAAAATIGTLGSLSLSKAHVRKIIPLALTPLFFALQQAFEGMVWLTINTDHTMFYTISTYCFLFFAGIFWPLWIPWSLFLIETNRQRKKLLGCTIIIGFCSAIVGFVFWTQTGAIARVMNHHITYDYAITGTFVEHWYAQLFQTVIYLMATVLPFFIASTRFMWIIGILVSIGFIVARIFYYYSSGSVWCFFATIGSGMLYFIVKNYKKQVS
jgi:hypothetical protein